MKIEWKKELENITTTFGVIAAGMLLFLGYRFVFTPLLIAFIRALRDAVLKL